MDLIPTHAPQVFLSTFGTGQTTGRAWLVLGITFSSCFLNSSLDRYYHCTFFPRK